MSEQRSDYTDEDVVEMEKYLKKYPTAKCWGTLSGLVIPYRFLKVPHLINIIDHIKTHPNHFEPKLLKTMEKLLLKKLPNTDLTKVLYDRG